MVELERQKVEEFTAKENLEIVLFASLAQPAHYFTPSPTLIHLVPMAFHSQTDCDNINL